MIFLSFEKICIWFITTLIPMNHNRRIIQEIMMLIFQIWIVNNFRRSKTTFYLTLDKNLTLICIFRIFWKAAKLRSFEMIWIFNLHKVWNTGLSSHTKICRSHYFELTIIRSTIDIISFDVKIVEILDFRRMLKERI